MYLFSIYLIYIYVKYSRTHQIFAGRGSALLTAKPVIHMLVCIE